MNLIHSSPIHISASFTAESVSLPLSHLLTEMGLSPLISFAPYNQIFQQLLDPASPGNQSTQVTNILLVRLEDWADSDAMSTSVFEELLDKTSRDFVSALATATKRFPASSWVVGLCPASLHVTQDTTRHNIVRRIENQLVDAVTNLNGPAIIHHEEIAALYPVPNHLDPAADELGRVPYTPLYFTALATALARRIIALSQPPRKVIVLDCDHTLWQGVCGESAPGELTIDGPWRTLQEFMVAQQANGRLLCLCSKNTESDVFRVFEDRPDMPLSREHLVAHRINWNAKSENLHALANELQLGLDSFIFVDDNPVECAEVEARCPGVAAIQLPADPTEIPHFLNHVWAFD
jgi:HAD superfamily phosphatase (TIGR01681 family)